MASNVCHCEEQAVAARICCTQLVGILLLQQAGAFSPYLICDPANDPTKWRQQQRNSHLQHL